jgi:hypothetical protein
MNKGQPNTNFALIGTPGGMLGNPTPSSNARAPICDQFGRLIIVIDGVISTAGETMDTTTWLGSSLVGGARTSPQSPGFHNVITIASSDDVHSVSKIFGYNNGATPGYLQLWFSNDLDPSTGDKELILVQPVTAYGVFNLDAFIPFHVFGGSLWQYMTLALSSDPLTFTPMATESLWANWNYTSKVPYP